MRRMKIKRAFNLDNVRCFLYGPGQNDDCEDLGLAPTAILNRRIDECSSVQPIYRIGKLFWTVILLLRLLSMQENSI